MDLFAGLDAQVPLALLPVRLETRFADPGTDVLHVRIFPDDAHIDGHDSELTDTEATLGAALWAAPNDLLAAGEAAPADPPRRTPRTAGRRAGASSSRCSAARGRPGWPTRPGLPPMAPPPSPTTKPQAYVRPPVARALPDRWLVRAYVGGAVVGEAWTSPVGVDLHLAPDPASVPDGTTSRRAPAVDPQMQWLVDYATAVSVGMAVDVPLAKGTQAVDRVVAVGVRASATAADSGTELANLLTAHRYTDGFGVLPVGSPTSNAPDAALGGRSARGPDRVVAARVRCGGRRPGRRPRSCKPRSGSAPGSSTGRRRPRHRRRVGARHADRDLGCDLGLLPRPAARADGPDPGRGSTVSAPTTWTTCAGRGTVPTVRIGRQPYGLLPITPLGQWTTDGASPVVDRIARLLERVRPLWQYGVGSPVTANEGPAFDAAFTAAMSTDAVARGYQIRTAMADRTFDPVLFTGIDPTSGERGRRRHDRPPARPRGQPADPGPVPPQAEPVRAPLVVDPTDPTPDATVQAAIRNLAATNPHLVLHPAGLDHAGPAEPGDVLHTLLRRSLLLEYAAAGTSLVSIAGSLTVGPSTPGGRPAAEPRPRPCRSHARSSHQGPDQSCRRSCRPSSVRCRSTRHRRAGRAARR